MHLYWQFLQKMKHPIPSWAVTCQPSSCSWCNFLKTPQLTKTILLLILFLKALFCHQSFMQFPTAKFGAEKAILFCPKVWRKNIYISNNGLEYCFSCSHLMSKRKALIHTCLAIILCLFSNFPKLNVNSSIIWSNEKLTKEIDRELKQRLKKEKKKNLTRKLRSSLPCPLINR